MASTDEFDGRFTLPAIDDPPLTETGVILMGLDADRLLAGLGLATLAGDPAQVALMVDQVRHDALHPTMDALIEAGIGVWRAARPALAEAARSAAPASVSAALRQAWAATLHTVAGAQAARCGPAGHAYLTACWLRRDEIDDRSARPT